MREDVAEDEVLGADPAPVAADLAVGVETETDEACVVSVLCTI